MADDKPFTICNNVDAMLYDKNMSIFKFAGLNKRQQIQLLLNICWMRNRHLK